MSIKRFPEYPMKQPFESTDDFVKRLRDRIQEESSERVADFDMLKINNVPWIDPREYGAVGDGSTDDTAALNAAVTALAAQGRGKLLSPQLTYYITDKIDFSGLHTSAKNNNYHIDFGGSLFEWGGSGATPMFYLYCNQNDGIRIYNFILDGNETASVKGIFVDSLQSILPSTNFTFSNFEIHGCATGIELGSTTDETQNAVANFSIENFYIDCGWETPQANDAVLFKSTNVDQGHFRNGTIGGTTPIGFHIDRSGSCSFHEIYGNNCEAFVYIDGPHGKLTFIDCAAENGTPPEVVAGATNEWLYFNTEDVNNRQHPITFIGCIFNDNSPVKFECGATGGQIVNFIGCDMDGQIDVESGSNNVYINLIGSHVLTDTTINLKSSGSRVKNLGSVLDGSVTYTGYNARFIDPVSLQIPNAIQTEASVSGAFDPDINEYDTFALTLTGDITIGNPTPGDTDIDNQLITFILTQDDTGSRTVSWGTDYVENFTIDGTADAVSSITFRKTAADTLVQVSAVTGM